MAKPYPGLNFGSNVDYKDVNAGILKGLNMLALATNTVISVTSGYRTYAQQAALYQRYIDSGKDIRYIAAPPGKSAHESGLAVDATVHGTAIANYYTATQLKQYGLAAPVSGDPVHIQLSGKGAPTRTTGKGTPAGQSDVQSKSAAPSNPVLFNVQGSHPADIQQNTGVSEAGPGMQPTQLADLWNSIANQQFTSPETKQFANLSNASLP